ncbi:MAG: hypothetical protein M3477_10785 [Gemmatimonadota bacterium]|nr:hypothetical protein [Gemmatimonadota bacterium]
MKSSHARCLRAVLLAVLIAACGSDELEAPTDEGETPAAGCQDGSVSSGALYRTCFPDVWNGDLIGRFTADPAARAAIGRFETSGRLSVPLVTLHTTGDPVVPFVHDSLYAAKAASAGSAELLRQRPVERYGHCSFSRDDLLGGFFTLLGIPSLPSQRSSSR